MDIHFKCADFLLNDVTCIMFCTFDIFASIIGLEYLYYWYLICICRQNGFKTSLVAFTHITIIFTVIFKAFLYCFLRHNVVHYHNFINIKFGVNVMLDFSIDIKSRNDKKFIFYRIK